MKQGFTLAELLGVIAILGIISLIAVPLIDNTINKRNEDLYQTQLNQIIKGAKSYYSEHLSELPQNNGESKIKPLTELQQEGYLPLDIRDPKKKEKDDPSIQKLAVKVTKYVNDNGESRFEYEIVKSTIGG